MTTVLSNDMFAPFDGAAGFDGNTSDVVFDAEGDMSAWYDDFSSPAPAPVASVPTTTTKSTSQWQCPDCSASMPVFAVSCPCGFAVHAAPAAAAAAAEAAAKAAPVRVPMVPTKRRASLSTAPRPSSTLAAVRKPIAVKVDASSDYNALEATEARERQLRQQLRQVEQNHAVLREYSNLLRKLLASAQVKVSAAANPFNVVGGRPKRLFRCSKADREPTRGDCKVRKATGKASGCSKLAYEAARVVDVQQPVKQMKMEPAQPSTLQTAFTDEVSPSAMVCLLDDGTDDHDDDLGDLVMPAAGGDDWMSGYEMGDAFKTRADSLNGDADMLSPFLTLADTEASW